MGLVVQRHAVAAAVHAEHALAATHDLLAVVEREAEPDARLVAEVARGFGDEIDAVTPVLDAQRRLVDDGGQPRRRVLERLAGIREAGPDLRRRAGQRERRELRDIRFAVMHLEAGVVDDRNPDLAPVGVDDQRLPLHAVPGVVAEIRRRRGAAGQQNGEQA